MPQADCKVPLTCTVQYMKCLFRLTLFVGSCVLSKVEAQVYIKLGFAASTIDASSGEIVVNNKD